jgi:hypothetical protein
MADSPCQIVDRLVSGEFLRLIAIRARIRLMQQVRRKPAQSVYSRVPPRPFGVLLLAVFVSTAYFYQAGGWNQNARFNLTRAIIEQRTVRIDD